MVLSQDPEDGFLRLPHGTSFSKPFLSAAMQINQLAFIKFSQPECGTPPNQILR